MYCLALVAPVVMGPHGPMGPGPMGPRGPQGLYRQTPDQPPLVAARVCYVAQAICYKDVAQTTCYRDVAETICYRDVAETICYRDVAETICSSHVRPSVQNVLEVAVCTFTLGAFQLFNQCFRHCWKFASKRLGLFRRRLTFVCNCLKLCQIFVSCFKLLDIFVKSFHLFGNLLEKMLISL